MGLVLLLVDCGDHVLLVRFSRGNGWEYHDTGWVKDDKMRVHGFAEVMANG